MKHSHSLTELQKACEAIASSAPGDTHAIASLMQQMSLKYYEDVLKQAQESFGSALIAASIGTLFFLYAIWRGMASDNRAWIAVIAGGLVQVISAINFYLYGRASRQFWSFHVCLERTNRFLLANTLCEKLLSPLQDQVRQGLVQTVANAPMLTLDVMEGHQSRKPTAETIDSSQVINNGSQVA
jgi:hypothetical protein